MNSKTLLQHAFAMLIILLILGTAFVFSSCGKEAVKVTATTNISGFSPSSGASGTAVVITGTNFSSVIANNVVRFNGMVATVTAAAAGQLTATVPQGATTGKITVTVTGLSGTASSSSDFTVQ